MASAPRPPVCAVLSAVASPPLLALPLPRAPGLAGPPVVHGSEGAPGRGGAGAVEDHRASSALTGSLPGRRKWFASSIFMDVDEAKRICSFPLLYQG